MVNKRLKKLMIEAVDNQLRDPETEYVKETYEEMRGAGYTAKEAEEPWPGMNELIEQGGAALDQDFRDPSAIVPWEKAWRIVRDRVKNADMPMEISDVDEATDYEYDLDGWLMDMMLSYQRMGEEEKCIRFCKEVLQTFAWEKESPSMFKRCIGECLMTLGKTEEGDKWYEEWLRAEWDPDAAIAGTFYWMARRNYGKAEQILDRILEESEGTVDYDGFYRSAAVFYRQMGKEKKAEAFDRIEKEYTERLKETEDDFEIGLPQSHWL